MSSKFKTLGICALVGGALFIFLGLQAKTKRQKLEKEGISVPGQITSAKINRSGKGKKNHYLYVTWNADGVAHPNGNFLVSQRFFATKVDGEKAVKSPDVTVRYVKGEEVNAIIVGGSTDSGGMEYLGYVVVLVGAFMTWKAFGSRTPVA